MGALADRFIYMLLVSSLVFVSCGDDEDDDDTDNDQQEVVVDRFSESLSDVVIDGETVYRYPRFSQYFGNDSRFEHYYLWYQCFQYGDDLGGKLIVESRSQDLVSQHNLEDLDGETLRSEDDPDIEISKIQSVEGRFWGCFIKATFSGRVTCRGDLRYEKSYNDKWGDLTGTTRTSWECSLAQPTPTDPTKRLLHQ